MPTDYNRIREENIGRYGTETAHLALLGDLYTERTHFIFELLQNAEDAKATEVEFCLGADDLLLGHDGRLFTPADVAGISSICQSTNQGDPERIGRFGIGFKSVYAYTRRPEIHSGDEHFAIEHYVRPGAATPRTPGAPFTTLICLPFNANAIPPTGARREIGAAFSKLDPISLLFLRHVQKVRLLTADAEPITLSRKLLAQLDPTVRLVATSSSQRSVSEQRWLLFDRAVKITTPAGKQIELRVEAAFGVTAESTETNLTVVPRDRANVAVFFPTTRPTGAGFILQGPFIPTPDRSNVREQEPLNVKLATESADLVVEALRWLRDRGFLSKTTLNAMPLKHADFPAESFLCPLFERVLQALKEERLLPGHGAMATDRPFVAGVQAKVASSSDLRELLSSGQLQALAGGETQWGWLADGLQVKGDSDLACYLRNDVGVSEVTASDFVSWLEKQAVDWWKGLDEGWLVRAYRYLQAQTGEHKRLRKLAIVRLGNGDHVSPQAQAVFFAADNAHEQKELDPFLPQLPIVRQSLLDGDETRAVENFLRQMGVARLAAGEFIRRVLIPRYANPAGITAKENRTHVRFVFQAFQRIGPQEKRELVPDLGRLQWLLCRKASQPGVLVFVAPQEAYLVAAYSGQRSLEVFFAAAPETYFVDERYIQEGEDWTGFLLALGCADHPRLTEEGHVLTGMTSALAILGTLSEEERILRSAAVFDVLTAMVPDDAYARSRWGVVQTRVWVTRRGPGGGDYFTRDGEARFFTALKGTSWLPDSSGALRRPEALYHDTESNRLLLGDVVAYLHKQIALDSEKRLWLASQLGLHRRGTKEAALARLKGLKSKATTVQEVTPLYEFFAQSGADVGEEFEEEELILCADAGPSWRAPSQVFWEDESPVFGATRGYLKKHYPRLREFFSGIGVPQSAGPTDYVEALLEIAKAGEADPTTQTRVHRVYKRLIPRLEEGGDWQNETTWRTYWTQLETGHAWLGRTGEAFGFHRLSELVRVDNEHIASLFEDKLAFWPFPDLEGFASEQLKITPISSAQCEFKVEVQGEVLRSLADRLSANWTVITAFLHSEKWRTAVRRGAEVALPSPPTPRLAERIAVTYELKGILAQEPGGKDAFVDAKRSIVWLAQKADEDDLVEALGDALQEFFGPEVLREFVCDIFRKDLNKAVEKWRKRGLLLNRPQVAEHPHQEGQEEVPSTSTKLEVASQDVSATTGQAPDQPSRPGEGPERPPGEHPSTGQEPGPLGEPKASPGKAAVASAPAAAGPLHQEPARQDNPTTSRNEPSGPGSRAVIREHGATPPQPAAGKEEQTKESPPSPPATPPEVSGKTIREALQDAFNKTGRTDVSDERPQSGPVGNPTERRKRIRANYEKRKSQEPAAAKRVTQRVIDVWDEKNKAIRDFLYEEYGGRCQICGETNRFPRRDGRAYFEAVYVIPHTEAAWTDEPGSVICLCALCSAKFQHGAVECQNIAQQIRAQKTANEGAHGTPVVAIKLIGKAVTITFSERHLLEVQELLDVAEDEGTGRAPSSAASPPSPPANGLTPATAQSPEPDRGAERKLVRCPHCHPKSPFIRKDRLQQHILKAHAKNRGSTVAGSKSVSIGSSTLRRCRGCGGVAVSGDDYCYNCK
jgi:hypothetical protein